MNEVTITVAGTVASDVEVYSTPDGTERATFRLAHNVRKRDRTTNQWSDGPTEYFKVTCWRALARNVKASLGKGIPVLVQGRLSVPERTIDGVNGPQRRVFVDLDADHVGVDLGRGVAKYEWVKSASVIVAEERALADVLAVVEAASASAGFSRP